MTSSAHTIHVAIELSNTLWLVGTRLPGDNRARMHRLAAGDVTGLLALLSELRTRVTAKLGQAADVACCFEAGRDGFWLHRLLSAHDIDSHVVEPASILGTVGPNAPRPTGLMPRDCCVSWPLILAATGRCAAWSAFPHPRTRTPSAHTASGSTWCRSAPATKTVSSRCLRRRASGIDHHCAHGIGILLRYGPATAGRYLPC
jgi:hypothetical protein